MHRSTYTRLGSTPLLLSLPWVFPKHDGEQQLGADWVAEGNLTAGETALLMLTSSSIQC